MFGDGELNFQARFPAVRAKNASAAGKCAAEWNGKGKTGYGSGKDGI